MKEKKVSANMEIVCGLFDHTKQGYYKHRKFLEKEQQLIDRIIPEVTKKRGDQPCVGVRKLQYMIAEEGIIVGRDKLFNILKSYGMLSEVYRRKCRTSTGSCSKYPNLIKAIGPAQRVGEIIASDITYLLTKKGFVYLSLTSDHFSDVILGHSLQRDLGKQGPLIALHTAMTILGKTEPGIHHSDHGSQYTSTLFQETLGKYGLLTSMTGIGKCYDNAKAERINGILKHELGLKKIFKDYEEALLYVKDAIKIYNRERLIITKGYKTPYEILSAA